MNFPWVSASMIRLLKDVEMGLHTSQFFVACNGYFSEPILFGET